MNGDQLVEFLLSLPPKVLSDMRFLMPMPFEPEKLGEVCLNSSTICDMEVNDEKHKVMILSHCMGHEDCGDTDDEDEWDDDDNEDFNDEDLMHGEFIESFEEIIQDFFVRENVTLN